VIVKLAVPAVVDDVSGSAIVVLTARVVVGSSITVTHIHTDAKAISHISTVIV